MERKYSVSELDALRAVVERKWEFGRYNLESAEHVGQVMHFHVGRPHRPGDKARAVEELVRTHMIAGHTAEDLIASEAATDT